MIHVERSAPAIPDASIPTKVTFPRSAVVGVVEDLLIAGLAPCPMTPHLELDFTASEFIDVPSLVIVIVTIAARKRSGLRTVLKLPNSKRTRDFLRLWQFPEAVFSVTGLSFRQLAQKPEDQKYFGENTSVEQHTYAGVYRSEDDGIRCLTRNRFFSLQTYDLGLGKTGTQIVLHESSRFNSDLVKAVLSKQLSGPNSYLPSRIVFESMTNAIRHPNARSIVCGSMLQEESFLFSMSSIVDLHAFATHLKGISEPKLLSEYLASELSDTTREMLSRYESGSNAKLVRALVADLNRIIQSDAIFDSQLFASIKLSTETSTLLERNPTGSSLIQLNQLLLLDAYSGSLHRKRQGYFTLVYWDDGESMIDTLKSAITEGKSVRSPSVLMKPDKFRFVVRDLEGNSTSTMVRSDYNPDKQTSDELLLLATTFPGITRDVTSKGYASSELKTSNPEYDAPGMGLHVLLNTVVDVFGGKVTFRTKRHFMSIKRDEGGDAKYLAKLEQLATSSVQFVGNMLTIRLPTKRQVTR